jgi:sterol 24-C-methyltransferase
MNKSEDNAVIKYYKTKESLWGYNLILKGVKHFGYYPKGKENISIADAQELMSIEIGKQLNLSEDSLVLDAGCGEGPVSVAIARNINIV